MSYVEGVADSIVKVYLPASISNSLILYSKELVSLFTFAYCSNTAPFLYIVKVKSFETLGFIVTSNILCFLPCVFPT